MALSPELLRKAQAMMAARREQEAIIAADRERKLQAKKDEAAAIAEKTATAIASAQALTTAVASMNRNFADSYGKQITYNAKQNEAISLAVAGTSFCLIGAAGTGKTTALNGCIRTLLSSGIVPALSRGTKFLSRGDPGIVCIAYTRRAVRQIARNVPKNIPTLTAHKLLEYEPVYYEYERPDGSTGTTMRFEPMRTSTNPLPEDIRTIIIDEASMFSTELYELVLAAIHAGIQIILLGDLHQIPPVYGSSILAAKLIDWPVVELTEVYRQALESPIIQIATAIKDGTGWKAPAVNTVLTSPDGKSKLTINPWKRRLRGYDDGSISSLPTALDGFSAFCEKLIEDGDFNEDEDVVLMPFNKACGTIELNKAIANKLAKKRKALVHHVIAGYENHYFAIGDRVLYDKQDAIIVDIMPNPAYLGKTVAKPAYSLNRNGEYDDADERVANTRSEYDSLRDINVEAILEQMAKIGEDDDKFNSASHTISVVAAEDLERYRALLAAGDEAGAKLLVTAVSATGDVNGMIFAYALTIHKSQGSEWRRVFLFLHHSHHTMCSRELIYTAITRAREELYIICEPDEGTKDGTLTRAAERPRIKGNTLTEKIQWLQEQAKLEAAKQAAAKAKEDAAAKEQADMFGEW